MNDWSQTSTDRHPHHAPHDAKNLPATAALENMSESMKRSHTARMNGAHRGSLDSAMKVTIRKRFDTADLFQSLNESGGPTAEFPEIKWYYEEEPLNQGGGGGSSSSSSSSSSNEMQKIASQSQLVAPTQNTLQGGAMSGLNKSQSCPWPLR